MLQGNGQPQWVCLISVYCQYKIFLKCYIYKCYDILHRTKNIFKEFQKILRKGKVINIL